MCIQGSPKTLAILMGFRNYALDTVTRKKPYGHSYSLPPLMGSLAGHNAQLEAEARVRKLGGKLKLEKDRMSTTLLALGLADRIGEQGNKLETSFSL